GGSNVDPGSQYGDRDAAGVERASMRRGIDPDRASAHRDDTGNGEASAEVRSDLHPGARRASGTHDSDTVITVVEATTAHEHRDRGIRQAQERRAIIGIPRDGQPGARTIETSADRADIRVRQEGSVVVRPCAT